MSLTSYPGPAYDQNFNSSEDFNNDGNKGCSENKGTRRQDCNQAKGAAKRGKRQKIMRGRNFLRIWREDEKEMWLG